jgi:hypothetical protein
MDGNFRCSGGQWFESPFERDTALLPTLVVYLIKLVMQKWTLIRVVGLAAATVLIIFGSVSNIFRTVKFALERMTEKR